MKNKKIIFILLIISIICITGCVQETKENPMDESLLVSAKSLSDSGWELYTSSTCHYCIQQKELIQNISDLMMYECDTSKIAYIKCKQENILGFPTWHNIKTGEIVVGYQSKIQLKNMLNNS